ncbi:response regulator transcription factor [Alteromonas halophila]|uniref:DNA-binding response regulator n=1 Tax=Alteromonas halophila TaxID=516698 RepID=A0A918JPA0_9ALTE|nr:response regulator [Alteromonas halophila]GGW93467.1 DNA-binding response regulator [Alteromonas halophila]
MRIILIDDDAVFLETLTRRLRNTGRYQVTPCESAKDALTLSMTQADALLLDMQLGQESGLDAIAPLRTRFAPQHLIMLTGYASIATTVEAMKRGATDYLAKPVSLNDIRRKLEGTDSVQADFTPLSTAQLEREHIEHTLHQHQGNISATAAALGMHRRTLQRKLKKFSRGS